MLYGYAGAIDGICERLVEDLGTETSLIATGGLAPLVVPYCKTIDEVDGMLTLTGLRILHEINAL